jgi:hypothetical protein
MPLAGLKPGAEIQGMIGSEMTDPKRAELGTAGEGVRLAPITDGSYSSAERLMCAHRHD